MPDIAEIKTWCDQARLLLSRLGADSRGKMQDRTSDVQKLLQKLNGVAGFEADYQRLLADFEAIGRRAKKAADAGAKAEAAAASRDLSILKRELQIKLSQDPKASRDAKKQGTKATDKLASPKQKTWADDKTARETADRQDALENLAETVRTDPLMTRAAAGANAAELLAAGVATARDAVITALQARDTRTQTDIDAARNRLPDLQAALDAAEAAARIRLEKDRLEQLANTVRTDPCMTRVPTGALPVEILTAGIAVARDAVIAALKARDSRTRQDIDQATALLPAVRTAVTAAEATARVRLEKDRLEQLANTVRTDPCMTRVPTAALPAEILAAGIATARSAVQAALKDRDTRTQQDIDQATALLPAVRSAVTAAEAAARDRLAEAEYIRRRALLDADLNTLWAVEWPLGQAPKSDADMRSADADMGALANQGKWHDALAPLGRLEQALAALKIAHAQSSAYLTAYAGIRARYDAALNVYLLKVPKLAVPSKAFESAYAAVSKTAGAADWAKAAAAVPALGTASDALQRLGAAMIAAKPGFDVDYNAMTRLQAARDLVRSPPEKLRNAEAKTFGEKWAAMSALRLAGDFTGAKAAIPALQRAIDQLLAANVQVQADKLAYEQAIAAIPDYASARALATSRLPGLATESDALVLAVDAIQTKVMQQDWTAATALVPALKNAALALTQAQSAYNGACDPTKKAAFAQKMAALRPRLQTADLPGPSPHVDALKLAVKNGAARILELVAAGDHATAETLEAKLQIDLAAMETALRDFQRHQVAFDTVLNGPVKTSRDVALAPDALKKTRDDALAATEARIRALAAKGSIAKADAMILVWTQEAAAWQSAKAASDNLHNDAAPDSAVLRALAGLPGGERVMDALMRDLPDGKPEGFMREALKIRYGIDVKRFATKNENLQDYTGLTPIGPDVPDKSLKKMYQLFCKVPAGNVKGKVNELIQFDEDAGGAAAGGKKIWMYCGRADDPKGGRQKFGEDVMPEGETIEEEFQVATGPGIPDDLPYFDFAALHEVGHAVDEHQHIMDSQPPGQLAGWQKHTRDEVAAKAAAHFRYKLDYVKAVLADAKSTPPTTVYPPEGGASQADWDKARDAVLDWCRSVRVDMALWNNPALSTHVAIAGRVYQEAYDGKWVSYLLSARAKGITGYQFRSSAEWFAELYAAYFSGKLKKSHPYAAWLKPLKKLA